MPLILRIAGIWLIYSSWSSVAGWILSFYDALGTTGYAVAAIPLLLLILWWWGATKSSSVDFKQRYRIALRRFRKFPPYAAWLLICLLVLAGGLLNPPSNYDALTYRLPRVLYWLQENQWYWIGALNYRMDIAGTGFEWMSLPLLAFGVGDRALFLLNYLPFVLIPGLFWVAVRGLGISGPQVRWWMWVWPLGYGIVLQAASVGNDMIGAVYALASLSFAMQARKNRTKTCLFFSAMAAIAMSSIKVTMLPLGLPLLVVWLWVALERLGSIKAFVIGMMSAICLIPCSFVPVAFKNFQNTGSWSGNPDNQFKVEVNHPIAGIVGNGFELVVGTIAPPVLPGSAGINQTIAAKIGETSLFRWSASHYPFYRTPKINELPSEESAGLGLGVALVVLLWIGLTLQKGVANCKMRHNKLLVAIILSSCLAGVVFLAKVGGNSAPRLMLPFTPFAILAVVSIFEVRRRFLPKNFFALIPAIAIFPAVCINPNRPLISGVFLYSLPILPSSVKLRMQQVYDGYSQRGKILEPLAEMIPEEQIVGFGGDIDHSPMGLFRPDHKSRVVEIMPSTLDSIHWIVGTRLGIQQRLGISENDWAKQSEFKLIKEMQIVSKVSAGNESWLLYRRKE
jgi:hypothetical protein